MMKREKNLLKFISLAVLLAAICAPSARAEDAAPVLNSCGNVNLAPAVDPVAA